MMRIMERFLERDVVLEIVELARAGLRGRLGRRALGRPGLALRRLALRGGAAAHALARAEHLHLVGDDLRHVLVLPVLVLPLARLQAALDVDLAALLQVLAGDLGELAEERDAVPLRLLLRLAVLVLPLLSGRDRD